MPGPLFFSNPITNVTDTNCSEGVQWVYKTLGDCIDTDLQYASVIIGLISIAIWMAVTFPQIYKNFKHSENIEGLSIFFLIFWLTGDSCNLIGCLMSKQLAIQMYTAVYYVFADVILISQYAYFQCCKRRRKVMEVNIQAPGDRPTIVLCLSLIFILSSSVNFITLPVSRWTNSQAVSRSNRHIPAGRNLLHFDPIFHGPIDETGYAIGILSTLFYVSGRLFQIRNNCKRQSTEGMSALMFLMAVFGNVTYGLAVFLRNQTGRFLVRHLPWIIGSVGIMNFDIFIMCQALWYRHKAKLTGELGDPFLHAETGDH